MRVRLLGSAAGGGFPQWNCTCPQCEGVRHGMVEATPRTQTSLAVSADDGRWLLCGASPDIGVQLGAAPALAPRPEGSPIRGVVLPNGDIDAWAGLLSLREWSPLTIFATVRVRRDLLERNAVLETLYRYEGHTRWIDLEPGKRQAFGEMLTIDTVPVAGVAPLHLRAQRRTESLDNVAVVLRHGPRSIAWCPCVGAPSAELERVLDNVDVAFFDGTFWSDDELIAAGRGHARARDMGHWPLWGPEGSLRWLAERRVPRKVLVHVNNTNPILLADSAERTIVEGFGIDVGDDGLELRP
jgi:pyrroloquinoline quinone biosynthesis protein B